MTTLQGCKRQGELHNAKSNCDDQAKDNHLALSPVVIVTDSKGSQPCHKQDDRIRDCKKHELAS